VSIEIAEYVEMFVVRMVGTNVTAQFDDAAGSSSPEGGGS
jgi:hypothetical protein